MAQNYQVNFKVLNKISNKHSSEQVPFSKEEFISSIAKCNNSSTLGSNKLFQRYLKCIVKNNSCLKRIINITDVCFKLGNCPSHFKIFTSIIIPKPNKESYDSFRPIILLNTLGKLIKKFIGDRLQFHLISNNFIHPSQLGGLKQRSMLDTNITLTHFIYSEWVKQKIMSTLAFNIAQFFPSLNHQLLPLILRKARFDPKVEYFFSNYLVGRKTWYFWNIFSSLFFNVEIGVGQGSALSSILSALYLASVLHNLEKCLKILKIPVSILFFVNDGLLIAQSKSLTILNNFLFYSYLFFSGEIWPYSET